jgi:hypothetical protein
MFDSPPKYESTTRIATTHITRLGLYSLLAYLRDGRVQQEALKISLCKQIIHSIP